MEDFVACKRCCGLDLSEDSVFPAADIDVILDFLKWNFLWDITCLLNFVFYVEHIRFSFNAWLNEMLFFRQSRCSELLCK